MAECLPCEVGYHNECPDIHTDSKDLGDGIAEVLFYCCCGDNTGPVRIERTLKSDEELKDVTSTGRKRAAQVKPISVGDICEWAGLGKAGGGIIPIVGCSGSLATNIHHGPDKSTLNNDPETNLWKICATCHNRWHTMNDPFYGERPDHGAPFLPIVGDCLPHDPITKATTELIESDEKMWSARK